MQPPWLSLFVNASPNTVSEPHTRPVSTARSFWQRTHQRSLSSNLIDNVSNVSKPRTSRFHPAIIQSWSLNSHVLLKRAPDCIPYSPLQYCVQRLDYQNTGTPIPARMFIFFSYPQHANQIELLCNTAASPAADPRPDLYHDRQ